MADRTGLWLIGARGSVATTALVGLAQLRSGATPATGCVTDQLGLDPTVFPEWDDFVVGGHDVASTPLDKCADELAEAGVAPQRVVDAARPELLAAETALRTGYDPSAGSGSQAAAVRRLASDLVEFRRDSGVARVVVVNVSSTEPAGTGSPEHDDLDALSTALSEPGRTVLSASGAAAYAALSAGCSYVDFTPSSALRLPAIAALAQRRKLPFAGTDGKTGETLLRSALAPMFVSRALRVLSWAGVNLLGGGDGATLADSSRARGKLTSKQHGLGALLGSDVTAPLHIDNVPDLGERKVAWDHVSFEGFLGARMSLQFSWDGYDSALAAPLVLDLARLVAGAHAAGESGALSALGFFFKDPLGSTEHRLAAQWERLVEWTSGFAVD